VRKDERHGSLAADIEAARAREREEHWRLLYVALTRAEERLVIGGALGPRMKGLPPAESWYARVASAMTSLGAVAEDDPIWAGAHHHRGGNPGELRRRREREPRAVLVPDWIRLPAPQEARPPRPL